jgi:hypothetical protein
MLAKYSSKETGSILGLEDKFIWGPSNLVEGMPICSNEKSAFLDFNGKSSTELLINIAGGDTTHMGTYCALFNQSSEVNCGFSDWYIPSFGQLDVFLENYSVKTMFDIIGGSIPEFSGYKSSTQYSETHSWGIDLYEGFTLTTPKNSTSFVHLVRDLEITDNNNYVIFGVSSPDGGFPYIYKVENGTTWEQLSKINDRFIIGAQGNVIFGDYPFYDSVKSGDIITSKIYSLELD